MALKGGVLLLPQQVNWVSSRFLTVQVHNVRVCNSLLKPPLAESMFPKRTTSNIAYMYGVFSAIGVCSSLLNASDIYVVRTIPDFFSSSFGLVMPTYWKPYTMYVVCGGHLLRIFTSTAQSSECGFSDNVSVSFNEGEDCVVLKVHLPLCFTSCDRFVLPLGAAGWQTVSQAIWLAFPYSLRGHPPLKEAADGKSH